MEEKEETLLMIH